MTEIGQPAGPTITEESHPHLIKEPFATYLERGKTTLRSHPLALFRKSPFQYKAEQDGVSHVVDSKPLSFGRATHSLILEGAPALWADYTRVPEELRTMNKNKKEYQTWKKEQTKFVLSEEEWIALQHMQSNVSAHESASGLLTGGLAERTVTAEYCGRKCQIRIDYFNNHIVDLKSCRDLDWFEYDARKFEYGHQLAFYRSVYSAACQDEFPPYVYIIAVESVAPYRVGVFKLDDDWLALGCKENERAIKKIDECEDFEFWPTGFEKMRRLGFYNPSFEGE